MNDEELNMQIRRFLKKVGIQSQREIEQAVNRALEAGTVKTGDVIPAKMTLQIESLQLEVSIPGEIALKD